MPSEDPYLLIEQNMTTGERMIGPALLAYAMAYPMWPSLLEHKALKILRRWLKGESMPPDKMPHDGNSLLSGDMQRFLSWLYTEQDFDTLMILDVIEKPWHYEDEWAHFIVEMESVD